MPSISELQCFRELVLVDFEFIAAPGERPDPVCLVAHELRSGRRFRLWRDQLGASPPYATGPDVLLVAYYASAELGCHRVLGWPMPERIVDLFVEFRWLTNMGSKADQDRRTPSGAGLLGALIYFGCDGMGATEKRGMVDLILRGGPWTTEERASILNYCEEDVQALTRLFLKLLPHVDLPRALLRGRYMAAAALMEHYGTPIDIEMLRRLREGWTGIQDELIAAIDADYGVYQGRTFKAERFAAWLISQGIPWPRL